MCPSSQNSVEITLCRECLQQKREPDGLGGFGAKTERKKKEKGRGKKRKVLVSAAQADTDPQSPCRVRDCGVL